MFELIRFRRGKNRPNSSIILGEIVLNKNRLIEKYYARILYFVIVGAFIVRVFTNAFRQFDLVSRVSLRCNASSNVAVIILKFLLYLIYYSVISIICLNFVSILYLYHIPV